MYKYYKKNGYDIMEYSFDSIVEFLEYIHNHSIRCDIFGNYPSSVSGGYEFCKTKSLEEAESLIKYGYHENFDKLIELKYTLEKYIKMSRIKSRQVNYYVGYAPDVKAYLEGNPLNMFNKEYPKRKHIDVYFNSAILSNVSFEQIYNRGAITLLLVEILENLGFSVALNIFTMSECKGQIHYTKFKLKNENERLNIQKLYFPMCHPSFLRRLIFRLREMTPNIINDWKYGYGTTCNDFLIRTIIDLKDNDIVICRPDEMNVLGNDIVEDANNMFDYINRLDGKDFVLEKIKKLEKKTRT